jgi:RNA polymerase sigma factor (sigma-70 family)
MTSPSPQEEFQALIEAHKKILYKVCSAYCPNRDDRDDLAQEILVQLWRSFNKFDHRCRFSTWMYRVALNVAISFYRRQSTRTRYVVAGEKNLLEAADDRESQSEEVLALHRFIATLDPLHKALVLLYLEGNNYLEIAEVLGITETNVATKLSRLKQTMKQELSSTAVTKSRS